MFITAQIECLKSIAQQLEDLIDSEQYQQLKEGDYQPDLNLEDALTAICYLLNHLEAFRND